MSNIAIKRPVAKILERNIQNDIRLWAAKEPGVTLFRNAQAMTEIDGRMVRTGLGPGSPDLVGSLEVRARPYPADALPRDRTIARALAIEVKRPGQKPSELQRTWMTQMEARGWVVGVAVCVQDAVDLVEKARRWEI